MCSYSSPCHLLTIAIIVPIKTLRGYYTYLLEMCVSIQVVYYDNDPINEVVEKTLEVLCHFIRFGYFDSPDDVSITAQLLIKLLDGKTDRPSTLHLTMHAALSLHLKYFKQLQL